MRSKSKRKRSKRQTLGQQTHSKQLLSKLLKTRLIRISMVIDDYVYKHKPISIKDARAYVEEVSKYKLQCGNDARSLQVIEKITRCMNALITEHQEENGGSSINFETPCPSPVYSLPDEDKTMFTEDPQPITETEAITNDIERNVHVEVEIHRAMSNLSIKENEHTQLLDETYSQSILEDCSANAAKEIAERAKSPETLIMEDSFTIRNELTNTFVHADTIDCSQSLLNDLNKDTTKSVLNIIISAKKPPKEKLFKTPINVQVPKKSYVPPAFNNAIKNIEIKNVHFNDKIEVIDITKPGTKNKKKPSQMGKQNKDTSQRRTSTVETPDKVVKRKKKSQKEIIVSHVTEASTCNVQKHTNCVTNNNNTAAFPFHKTKANSDKDFHNETQSSHDSTLVNSNKQNYNKRTPPIYNRNAENDLSWIENIRYVREISSEEFESKDYLNNTFWENLTFPGDWNKNDFNY